MLSIALIHHINSNLVLSPAAAATVVHVDGDGSILTIAGLRGSIDGTKAKASAYNLLSSSVLSYGSISQANWVGLDSLS